MKVEIVCSYCGKVEQKDVSAINLARRIGSPLFCSRQCSAERRRINRPVAERKRLKSEYDAKRREVLHDELCAKKREHHRLTYDPVKARAYRKHRAFDHTAYCRRYYADPVKKAGKFEYDVQRRGREYAEYMEAWRLLIELERTIRTMVPDRYERQKNRGYFLKINERKRHDRQDRRTA